MNADIVDTPAECVCPAPSLYVAAEGGDIPVRPSATPGGLALLYVARCARCGRTYARPFRPLRAAS